MSTSSYLANLRKGIRLSALSALGAVLIVVQFFVPSVAFAAPARPADFGQNQALDRAGVSVVRVVSTYTTPGPVGGTSLQCTGLGVLVASWNPQGSEFNNWVLTDGALTNTTATASCTSGTPDVHAQLSTIQVVLNKSYNPNGALTVPSVTSNDVLCENKTSCSKSAALLPFHTNAPQPFVSLSSATTTGPSLGIELVNAQSGLPPTPVFAPGDSPQQYLTLKQAPSTAVDNENGLPLVDNIGKLVGIHLNGTSSYTVSDIQNFMQTIPQPSSPKVNAVNDNWDKGVTDFYAKNYSAAHSEFQTAATANPDFKAATAFAAVAASKPDTSTEGTKPGQRPTVTPAANTSPGISLGPIIMPYLALVGMGLILLIALLIMVSVRFGRARALRRQQLAHFKADEDAARQAAQRQQSPLQATTLPLQPMQQAAPMMNAQPVPPRMMQLPCPSCTKPIAANSTFCPNCGALLVASESGLRLRLRPPDPVPPEPPVASRPSSRNGNASLPPPPSQPGYSVSDEPTLQMSPAKARSGQEDGEKPLAGYDVQQFQGRNMSLAVGTLSNPGIKRQHKPNEDSLFAAQGTRTHNSHPQQFGLFVVADGMGGHANGQDASRLAIQTIVDQMLPKLGGSGELHDEQLQQLLVDGVQSANKAVHQRNMEHRADMGTTMTATLIVGTTAYIANVGDSRTYLYREAEGLRKVTNDHSVVASLVDAGIIKPDDIYTHPKRNQIYRSLGEKPVVEVDAFIEHLQPGDKLLLCSDGLWDMVRDPNIQQVLERPAPDPNQTGNALIKAALEGGGEDNVSVIVIHVTETTTHTGMTGIQLLAKPETVEMPKM